MKPSGLAAWTEMYKASLSSLPFPEEGCVTILKESTEFVEDVYAASISLFAESARQKSELE